MATQRIDATSGVAAVKVEAGNRLRFSFDIRTDATSFDREGDALVITLKDGRKVVLEDFFVVVKGGDELPVFVLDDGAEVASADFLLSMNPDLDVTASGKTSGGIEEYADNTDELAEWTDVLGKAETDTWSSGVSAPDPVLSPEYVSLAASYSGMTSDGWSLPPTSGGATIIPQLPADERPNDPLFPPDRPDNPPPPVTPDGPAVPVLDERFVFSRDNAGPENFERVLRNDGERVTLRGVLDEDGNLVTLDDLAVLSAGDGLETGTGKLFMKDGTLVFQAKPGVGADDTELVTYVGVDADGKAYTRNVEIRFTDTTGGFSSNDAVDTYYVNTNISSATNSLTEQDNIQLGAGSDLVIMEGFQADNSSNWTINVGGGDNTIILKSAEGKSTASSSSTVNVESGTGNDTIALEAAKYVAYDHSTVTVKGDDGDDSISVTSLGNYMAHYHSSVNVGAGDGNDTIALDSPRFLAYYNSTVTVDGGADDDVISLTSRSYIALEDSSVNVLGGDGDDVVSVKSGGYMAGGSSSVNVHGDGGNDTIAIEAVELSGIIMVDGGTGDDLIEMRGGRAHGGVSITGGEGADTFSFGGAELPGNTIRGGIVITDFNAGEGDRLQLKNLLPPDAEENLDQYLSISKYGSNNEDLLLTINKSGQEGGAVTDRLVVRLEGVLADGGSGMDGMADPSIDDLITNNIIILNSGG